MSRMKLNEVAAFLGRSIAQTRRYMDDGLLTPTKEGNQLFFEREQVVKFAESRGIRTLESEVPQDPNFTHEQQEIEHLLELRRMGWKLSLVS